MKTNLIRISNAENDELPISKHTGYKWHCEGRYPRLVFKVGSILFFDLDEWQRMIGTARERTVKRSKRFDDGKILDSVRGEGLR